MAKTIKVKEKKEDKYIIEISEEQANNISLSKEYIEDKIAKIDSKLIIFNEDKAYYESLLEAINKFQ